MRLPFILSIALCTSIFLSQNPLSAQDPTPFAYSIQKTAFVNHGAVVSAHPLASFAGLTMLRQGGNAFDAAIATQFALAVVYPGAGNIGGGGFTIARLQDGRTLAIDFREKAPEHATRD